MNSFPDIITKIENEAESVCPELFSTGFVPSLLLAVSGGADSMAMLNIFETLSGKFKWRITVAHLNHCLRGSESDQDQELVTTFCSHNNIPCFTENIDVKSLAQNNNLSIETAARKARYDFFYRLCLEQGCSYIITAHHSSDNAETILQRIIRGTGLKGLAGIASKRIEEFDGNMITIFRPMLNVSRAEIEEYVQTNEISYRHDSSNFEVDFTRNKLRNILIPELKEQYNNAIVDSLLTLGKIASDSDAILRELAKADLAGAKAEISSSLFSIELASLVKLSPERQRQLLYYVFNITGPGMGKIDFRTIEKVQSEIRNEKSRKVCDLPGSWIVEISSGKLIIAKAADKRFTGKKLIIPGPTDIDGLVAVDTYTPIASVEARHIAAEQFDLSEFKLNKPPYHEIVDTEKIKGELTIAPLQTELRYSPLGLRGSQTTGDIMTNNKVPQYLRNAIAAIYDDDGVVCIPGCRIADRVKVTSNTDKIIRLEFKL